MKLVVMLAIGLHLTSSAIAQEWSILADHEFEYVLPIPSDYRLSTRPSAGNARVFHNSHGDLLAVWASQLGRQSFREMVEERRRRDEAGGWVISYERVTRDWASYSGIKGAEIRYVRAIRYCGDRTALFLIDYALAEKVSYDPIVTHMVRGLQLISDC